MAVETSENEKLGGCSCTYLAQHSCPDSCPLLGAGCYAEYGPLHFITHRLNQAPPLNPAALARREAAAIAALTGDRPLRLHVVGDARTPLAARILAEAAESYRKRGSRPVWTYTHAWRVVPRSCWGTAVSVLASCESTEQVARARGRGYAAALVVPSYQRESAYDLDGVRVVPCPWQTRGVTCRDCRLCFDDQALLRRGHAIAFAAHGAGAATVRLALRLIQTEGGT
jgi:hypothetical protein